MWMRKAEVRPTCWSTSPVGSPVASPRSRRRGPLDTRNGTGQCGLYLGPAETRTITIAGRGGVPATTAEAAVLNIAVTQPAFFAGYLSVWPAGSPQPFASTLNYVPGQTVANTVLVGLGAAGQVSIHNYGGPTEVLVDVTGYFPGTTPGGTPAPCPPLTTSVQVPAPGRPMPDSSITTTFFNANVGLLRSGRAGRQVAAAAGAGPHRRR